MQPIVFAILGAIVAVYLAGHFHRWQRVHYAWRALVRGDADAQDIQVLTEFGLLGPITLPKQVIVDLVARQAMDRLRALFVVFRW